LLHLSYAVVASISMLDAGLLFLGLADFENPVFLCFSVVSLRLYFRNLPFITGLSG